MTDVTVAAPSPEALYEKLDEDVKAELINGEIITRLLHLNN